VPWRNGGGETAEVAAFPPGAGMDDFVWRISIAEVRGVGPFSDFPGTDRILSVLEGNLSLTVADAPEIRLNPAAMPFAFPADVPASGVAIGGDVRDLNVMVRRGLCAATVERFAAGTVHIDSGGEGWLMIVATGNMTVACGGGAEALARHDAILFENPVPPMIGVDSDAPGFAIRLWSVAE